MCNISVLSEMSFHNNETSTVNAKMIKLSCVKHAYQPLACETAINADFSELFSLKCIYVKYKNAILSLIYCFFRT